MDIFNNIRQWAETVGIMAEGNQTSQLLKFQEESRELELAINCGDDEGTKDELGDTAITLVLLAEMSGFTIEDALECAYQKINKRVGKGKMINGQFVKDRGIY